MLQQVKCIAVSVVYAMLGHALLCLFIVSVSHMYTYIVGPNVLALAPLTDILRVAAAHYLMT
jgi:hypothetical protein